MGVPQSLPIVLYCDNRSAIQIVHNDIFHEHTKHIEIDCHFVRQHVTCNTVRQHVTRNTIRLLPVSSKDQSVDVFTKVHPPSRFQVLVSKLEMVLHLLP